MRKKQEIINSPEPKNEVIATPQEKQKHMQCINCGAIGYISIVNGIRSCPVCKHAWTAKDERAPFVMTRR